MRIFGQLWDAPVCEGKVAEPAPVGEECIDCGEPIAEGDSGYIMACYTRLDGEPDWRPQHRECGLLHVAGHGWGYCRCTGYGGMTRRQAALKLWDELQRYGTPPGV